MAMKSNPKHRPSSVRRPGVGSVWGAALCLLVAQTAGAAVQTPAQAQAAQSAPQGQPAAPAAAPAVECTPAAAPQPPARRKAAMLDQGLIDEGVLEGTELLEEGLEIGGLTTDQMVTKFGHDLFDTFIRYWRPPEGVGYNLLFSELADPMRGSMATVRLNDQVIFEGPLSPREEAITELGRGLARDIRNLLRSTAQLEEEEYF